MEIILLMRRRAGHARKSQHHFTTITAARWHGLSSYLCAREVVNSKPRSEKIQPDSKQLCDIGMAIQQRVPLLGGWVKQWGGGIPDADGEEGVAAQLEPMLVDQSINGAVGTPAFWSPTFETKKKQL